MQLEKKILILHFLIDNQNLFEKYLKEKSIDSETEEIIDEFTNLVYIDTYFCKEKNNV